MRGLVLVITILFYCTGANAEGYLQAPFNVAAKKLPVSFSGHDFTQVYDGLRSQATGKGKYETTKDYEARVKKVQAQPLFGKVYRWSPLAYVLIPSWCDYNADTQIFRAHFAFAKRDEMQGTELVPYQPAGYSTARQPWVTSDREYVGQNAFGATVDARATTLQSIGMWITQKTPVKFTPTGEGVAHRVSFATKIGPKAAERLEKNIAAVFVVYLTDPCYTVDYTGSGPATIDSPTSDSTEWLFPVVRLKSIWFYDYSTGYVFKKIP